MSFRFALSLATLGLLLAGCPSEADDDTAGPDDDDVADDDDVTDDDDATDDDDGADDDDAAIDYIDATAPAFGDCAGNQVKLMLGDGTEIGPFDGFFPRPESFANNFPQFSIRIGVDDAWVALNGNYDGMSPGTIPFETPSSTPGNVVLQAALMEASLPGGAPVDLAGNYGFVTNNLHPDVGGSVTFDGAVPGPNVAVNGTFQGIIQKVVSFSDQVVLLGVSGCFDATLEPTDG